MGKWHSSMKQALHDQSRVRFAAVGDLHCRKTSIGQFSDMFVRASAEADVVLLCGDLTDYGLPDEARILADELSVATVPVVAVLGNHDFESDEEEHVSRILSDGGVQVLDGEACEIHGVGIAGIKGFAGGYGSGALGTWGERVTKQFVNEAIGEALKLEAALARLRTNRRIVLMHYAPVVDTVRGEPIEIFAFLGSSRLAEPLSRYPVDWVVHGHAHRGSPEGASVDGTRVFNVAMPLLKRLYPDQPGYRLLDVEVDRP